MKLKLLTDITRGDLTLKEGEIYEVAEIFHRDYIILVPKKHKGKNNRVYVLDQDAELIED